MSGSALTPSHENGSSWLATLPRTARMNAKAAKVAKGAATAAHLIASLAVTRGGQLCDLRGLCVHLVGAIAAGHVRGVSNLSHFLSRTRRDRIRNLEFGIWNS